MLTNSHHPTSSTVTVSLPIHPRRRVGHFADGMAHPVTLAALRIGSFADGMYTIGDTPPATVPVDRTETSRDELAA
jgi:hypothetical protein